MSLIGKIIDAENAYCAVFSENQKTDRGIRYTNNDLPQMFSHSFFMLGKDHIPEAAAALDEKRAVRKRNGQDFVQMEAIDAESKSTAGPSVRRCGISSPPGSRGS